MWKRKFATHALSPDGSWRNQIVYRTLLQLYWVHSQSHKSKTGKMYVGPMVHSYNSMYQETAGHTPYF